MEDVRSQLKSEIPKRSRIAPALDLLKSSAGSVTALIKAVADLSAAIDHLMK
jgi:hypothetical protein